MILATGGLAPGDISTRSRFMSLALLKASLSDMIPSCSPSGPIIRSSLARIAPLIRIDLLISGSPFLKQF